MKKIPGLHGVLAFFCVIALAGPVSGADDPFGVPDASLLKDVPKQTRTPPPPVAPLNIQELQQAVALPPVPVIRDNRNPFTDEPEVEENSGTARVKSAPPESVSTDPQIGRPQTSLQNSLDEEPILFGSDKDGEKKGPLPSEQALKMLTDLAKKGNSDAMFGLGRFYYRGQDVGKDYAQAVQWFAKAAKLGQVKAMYALGSCYYLGHGVQRDQEVALRLFVQAGEKGHAPASFNAGLLSARREGAVGDESKARTWYRAAARLGSVEAMGNLGVYYIDGKGGNQDARLGGGWLVCAATRGNKAAAYSLGILYAEGLGVPKDESLALRWLAVAARAGYKQGLEALFKTTGKKDFDWKNLPPPEEMSAANREKPYPCPE
jgi:hypothetical protein